jgi:DNA-binding response OmpR family regulator
MKKILLIEDNHEIAEHVADILIISGYIVDIANNSDRGQQSLFNYKADLIISDITMPGMDGLELLQLIRKDPSHKSLPFIILSGRTSAQDVEAGLNAGANIYLRKPCDADELVLSVSQLIGRRGYSQTTPQV